ncbi:MAG: BACON domain-containing protein [Bacteroidales bacterium]|nr:BACON domain-containing protein [Bacteroidales bacterium]
MKRILTLVSAVLSAIACNSLRPTELDIVQLGIVPDDIIVPSGAGEDGVRIIADRDYALELLSGADWLTVGLTARDSISFSFASNEGYRRSARLKISASGREDELLIKQEGAMAAYAVLSAHSLSVPAQGGSFELRLSSSLPSDYFSVSVTGNSTVRNMRLSDYILTFDVAPTTNRDKRSYVVTVSYLDGWGDAVSDSVTIVQDAYD